MPMTMYGVELPPRVERNMTIIMKEENKAKVGYDRTTKRWTPHTSVEGGLPTVGFGHKLSNDELRKGTKLVTGEVIDWSKGADSLQIMQLLMDDLIKAKKETNSLYKEHGISKFNTDSKDVVTRMVFQMGKDGVRGFKNMWGHLKNQNYAGAATEMRDSCWANPTLPRCKDKVGTPKRANREADIMGRL